jgi:hypothetical protein
LRAQASDYDASQACGGHAVAAEGQSPSTKVQLNAWNELQTTHKLWACIVHKIASISRSTIVV